MIAQEPSFEAVASSGSVLQHSVFEINFELQNAGGHDFTPPDFRDFKVVGGPSIGSSTMIVNGEVSRSQSWTYSLLAVQDGEYTIGPATVVAGRKRLTSQPIKITVVAADRNGPGPSNDEGSESIKLVAFVEPGDYYPGQQIILHYKLLFRENVQTINTLSEDDYSGFFVQNVSSVNRTSTYETINGLTYTSRIIKSIALFAHQSGTYTIDPLIMDVGVSAPYPGNQGFFTMRRLQNIQIASAPITIDILSLKPDTTQTFTGAVGQYEITAYPGNTTLTTNEAFNLRIEVKGNGDFRRWDPPKAVTNGDFEMYDPRIIEDRAIESNGSLIQIRSIEYLMLPRQPGKFSVHVPLRYFNPQTRQYETLSSDTISLTVIQGQNIRRGAEQDTSMSVPLRLKRISGFKSNDKFWGSIPHVLLFGLIVSCTFYGAWVSYRKRNEELLPEAERKRSISARRARELLEGLQKGNQDQPDRIFFEKATEIYYRFLSEKFIIPPADLNRDMLHEYLEQAGIAPLAINKAIRFFEQCQVVRYGGIPGGFTRDEMISTCQEIIDQLEA